MLVMTYVQHTLLGNLSPECPALRHIPYLIAYTCDAYNTDSLAGIWGWLMPVSNDFLLTGAVHLGRDSLRFYLPVLGIEPKLRASNTTQSSNILTTMPELLPASK